MDLRECRNTPYDGTCAATCLHVAFPIAKREKLELIGDERRGELKREACRNTPAPARLV
jgi:hypothetical protein